VGRANAIPATKNYASEVFALGILAGVNQPGVQWASLVLEEPPRWSRLTSTPSKYEARPHSRRTYDGWLPRDRCGSITCPDCAFAYCRLLPVRPPRHGTRFRQRPARSGTPVSRRARARCQKMGRGPSAARVPKRSRPPAPSTGRRPRALTAARQPQASLYSTAKSLQTFSAARQFCNKYLVF